MTGPQYDAWRRRMGFSHVRAAAALGISVPHSKRFSRGSRDDGTAADGAARPVPITRAIALACAALEAGLEAE